MSETQSVQKCAICSQDAPFKCTGCKCVSYCGQEHQKKHWKEHKLTCRPFQITSHPELNRVLKVTRDIRSDTVIFTELPLIFGQKWSFDDEAEPSPVAPCVGCFNLTSIMGHKCPKCYWPACRPDCDKLTDPLYHAIECSILALSRVPRNISAQELINYYRSDAILTLKCILLQKIFPKKWEQLMLMQSHENERKGTPLYDEADARIVSYLQQNYLEAIRAAERHSGKQFLPHSDSDTLHRIIGIMEVNFMLIGLPNGQEVSGVYPTACIIEHSCIPNCYYTFDVSRGFKITVKAGVDIKQGDHLKIMYTHMLWGTQLRREHLKATKYFDCCCERCSDPTELGTYFSALKCIGSDLSTCGGYQLPVNPLDNTTDWVCNKCATRISSEHACFLMSKMSDEVDTATANKFGNIKELESLIDKLSQFLHPNHYHIFALKHALIQQYGNQPGYLTDQMSDDLLKKKREMCEDLLKIICVLDPGSIRLSIYTSIILYELHLTLVALCLRNTEKQDEKLLESKAYIDRAKKIIEIELDSPTGRQLHEKLCKAESNLKNILDVKQ